MRKVLDSYGVWRPIGKIMPDLPDPADPRGILIPFHGRYRDAHNTGVPDRTALSAPIFGYRIDTPNQTFNDVHFVGYVEINATGIVFNRCFFESRGDLFIVNAFEETTLNDCDIYGGLAASTAVIVTGSVHAVRCHIWGGGQDSVGFDDYATYDDCYIHGAIPHFGAHGDVVQTLSGINLAVRRCKLLAYDPVTGSADGYNTVMQLGVISPSVPLDGLEVIDNYVDGGGYTLNGNLNTAGVSNVVISGNRWGRHFSYGPIAASDIVVPPHGTFANNNVFDDDGTPVA